MAKRIEVAEIQVGDILYERNIYNVLNRVPGGFTVQTLSGETATIADEYVSKNISSPVQFFEEKSITRTELKAIFASIQGSPFYVEFQKLPTVKTKKKIAAEKEELLKTAHAMVGFPEKLDIVKALTYVIDNPVLNEEPGETRHMIAIKTSESIDGFYSVIDLAIKEERKVNVNTIKVLVSEGVKYTIK